MIRYMTLLRVNKNNTSNINAHTVIAILPIQVVSITTNGTIALKIRTNTWATNVINERFKNFSKLACLSFANFVESIYFFSAFICQMILVRIHIIAYKHQENVV